MLKSVLKEYVRHVRMFSRNARYFLGGSFFMGFYFSIYWTMLNLYFKQLGLNEGAIGMINSIGAFGSALAAIPAAIVIDRVRIKRVMIAAAVATAVSDIMLVLVTDIRLIGFFAAAAAAGASMHFVAVSPFFMRNSTAEERTYLYGVNHALDMTAGFFGALIGGYIPRLLADFGIALINGYRAAFMTGALMAFVSVGFYSKLTSDGPIRSGSFRLADYTRTRSWKNTFRLCLPNVLIGLGAGFTIPFLNLYFAGRFGLDSSGIGRIYSIAQVFTVFGFLAGPALAKRLGLVRTISFSQLASIPFFVILAYCHQLAPVVVAFWFRNSLMNMASPLFSNFAMEKTEPEHHAGTNSLLFLSWSGAWMISTFVGGRIIEHHGFVPVMLTTIALYFVAAIATLKFFARDLQIGGVSGKTQI